MKSTLLQKLVDEDGFSFVPLAIPVGFRPDLGTHAYIVSHAGVKLTISYGYSLDEALGRAVSYALLLGRLATQEG